MRDGTAANPEAAIMAANVRPLAETAWGFRRKGRRMSGPRIGLALGGGSARGLAHIPMLEVFDELGIKPAVIAGCSIGALIGAAYASGMPARDIARPCADKLLNNRIGAARYVFGAKRARLARSPGAQGPRFAADQGRETCRSGVPRRRCRRPIEDTLIPFKVVTTDYERMDEQVITSGTMVQAVAASIAIPGVISVPAIDDRVHVDGGVTNPVPFNHVRDGMRHRRGDRCHRPAAAGTAARITPIWSWPSARCSSCSIRWRELRRALAPPDIYIEPPVESFQRRRFLQGRRKCSRRPRPAKDKLKRALELRINEIT